LLRKAPTGRRIPQVTSGAENGSDPYNLIQMSRYSRPRTLIS